MKRGDRRAETRRGLRTIIKALREIERHPMTVISQSMSLELWPTTISAEVLDGRLLPGRAATRTLRIEIELDPSQIGE